MPSRKAGFWRGRELGLLSNLGETLRLLLRVLKIRLLFWAILLVLAGLLPVLNIVIIRDLINVFVDTFEIGSAPYDFSGFIDVLTLFAAVNLFSLVIGPLLSYLSLYQTEIITDHIREQVLIKASTLDFSYLESTEYHNQLYRVSTQATHRPVRLLESLALILRNGITLIGILTILWSYSPLLLPLLLFGLLPGLLIIMRHSRVMTEWQLASSRQRRRAHYFESLIVDRRAAMELHIFGAMRHFVRRFVAERLQLRHELLALQRRRILLSVLASLISLGVVAVAMVWVVLDVMQNQLRAADLVTFYQLFNQGRHILQAMLSAVNSIYQDLIFMRDYFKFMALESRLTDAPQAITDIPPLKHQLALRDVAFRYPNSDRQVLEQFALDIPAGKLTAIVGENGAGKTTVFKLLCRLYDPQAGQVLWDGQDIREFSLAAYYQQVTVITQSPYHYQDTALQNIIIDRDAYGPAQNLDEVRAAARIAEADTFISQLPQGYHTMLGKLFGGEDLSGGQWQRVALARAFLRQSNLIILDEPTHNMDPWTEQKWLKNVRHYTRGKTVVMITHRFTSAMHADLVHVIHDGELIESGTHADLLKQQGRYATGHFNQQFQSAK